MMLLMMMMLMMMMVMMMVMMNSVGDNDNNDVGEYGEHSNDDSNVNDEYDDDGLTSSVCSSLFLTCQVGISIDFMLAFPLLQCHCQIPRQGLKASLDPKSIAKLSGR